MKKHLFLLIISLGLLYCCNNEIPQEEEAEDNVVAGEITLQDTLLLEEGTIPEQWEKVELQNGYYIGFPQKPRKKDKHSQIDWKLKRKQYQLYTSLTDLTKEPSYEDNKQYREDYYEAIIQDLAEGIEGELAYSKSFISQKIYEGQEAKIEAEDAIVYMRCVIIGTTLYSFGLVLFADEKPAYLQMKEKFFYSFGKELYILEPEPQF